MSCSGPMKAGGRRTRRKMKGGNFYSFGFDPQTGTGGAGFAAVENNAVDAKTGAVMPDYAMPAKGGKRRGSRKSKKTTRKGKKGMRRTRKMKGGANWASVGAVGAAFKGEGSGGLANYSAYAAKAPAGGPVQNPDGAYRA
jgi:hypothetical protein